jgi:ABC-type multidrug transport system fused ATPase/permease subunit
MHSATRKAFKFLLKIIHDRSALIFWTLIRFISAIFPLITIYLYSRIVKLLEIQASLSVILITLLLILLSRLVDNYLRLLSISQLEYLISNLSMDIHNFFLLDHQSATKAERSVTIQAVRNFSDAAATTLNLIKQPGIDSLVSLIFIPLILFVIDFPAFVITFAYILSYYFIDYFTTQRYSHLRDIQNSKTEAYYAKMQADNDFDLEQNSYNRHFRRITQWSFKEWNFLQGASVIFYFLVLVYLVFAVLRGEKDISDLVLVMGYVTQTQTYLNAFSNIKDSFTDMNIGLRHLADDKTISTIDLDDLT